MRDFHQSEPPSLQTFLNTVYLIDAFWLLFYSFVTEIIVGFRSGQDIFLLAKHLMGVMNLSRLNLLQEVNVRKEWQA